jgi:hypothetical protein
VQLINLKFEKKKTILKKEVACGRIRLKHFLNGTGVGLWIGAILLETHYNEGYL